MSNSLTKFNRLDLSFSHKLVANLYIESVDSYTLTKYSKEAASAVQDLALYSTIVAAEDEDIALQVFPSKLVLYTLNGKKCTNIVLPCELLSAHTFIHSIVDDKIRMEMILKNNVVLCVYIPVDFVSNSKTKLESFYEFSTPYDFSIRKPHYMVRVNEQLIVVFFQDGGLLGLNGDSTILFNDNSYLQSFTRMFTKKAVEYVVSCCVLGDNKLVTLTSQSTLKVWDLNTFTVIGEQQLSQFELDHVTLPHSMCLYKDQLCVYIQGSFKIFDVSTLEQQNEIKSNTKMSLCDLKFHGDKMYVLWKSSTNGFVQIFENGEWTNCQNKSFIDTQLTCITENVDEAMMILNARYGKTLVDKALQYVGDLNNLENLLKEMKRQQLEPLSLSFIREDMLVVNTVSSHSLYKPHFGTLERYYYNNKQFDDLSNFLHIIDTFFVSQLSDDVVKAVSHDLITLRLPIAEKFTHIFQKHMTQITGAAALLNSLSATDILANITAMVQEQQNTEQYLIECIQKKQFNFSAISQAVFQKCSINQHFNLRLLLVLVLLEFDYSLLEDQLEFLFRSVYFGDIFLESYNDDKLLETCIGDGYEFDNTAELDKIVLHYSNNSQNILNMVFEQYVINSDRAAEFLTYFSKYLSADDDFLLAIAHFRNNDFKQSALYFDESFNKPCTKDIQLGQFSVLLDQSRYYYELARLFYEKSPSLAFKFIEKSQVQDNLYLEILLALGDYLQIMTVLTAGDGSVDKQHYFRLLLEKLLASEDFVQLLKFSSVHQFVNQDYEIVDSILNELNNGSLQFARYIYSFRNLNNHSRQACELLYNWCCDNEGNPECYKQLLMVVNTMKAQDLEWLLHGKSYVTLASIDGVTATLGM